MDVGIVLRGVLPAVAAALVLVGLGGPRWLGLAAALGLWGAHARLKGVPAWPHELLAAPSGVDWLVWCVLAAALAALAERRGWLTPAPASLPAALPVVVLAAGSAWLVLQKLAVRAGLLPGALLVGTAALLILGSVLVARAALARAPRGVAPAVPWTAVLAADAALLTIGGSAFLGQLAGAVAAAVGAAALTAAWRPFALERADGTWLGTAHALFVLAGVHLAYVPWTVAACALLAPLPWLLLRRSAHPARQALSALLLALAPLGAGGWLAWSARAAGS